MLFLVWFYDTIIQLGLKSFDRIISPPTQKRLPSCPFLLLSYLFGLGLSYSENVPLFLRALKRINSVGGGLKGGVILSNLPRSIGLEKTWQQDTGALPRVHPIKNLQKQSGNRMIG